MGSAKSSAPASPWSATRPKKGLHIFEDHFIPEIINPETGEVLPYGETGELVFTSITKEAFPVIRYRTRDITSLNPEPCICGRTMARMNKVSGRSDDMLIIRGVNVFPSQIESVLMEMKNVEPHYQLVVDREGSLDILTVMVEVSESMFSDEVKTLTGHGKRNYQEYQRLPWCFRQGETGGAEGDCAQSGESGTGHRQPENLSSGGDADAPIGGKRSKFYILMVDQGGNHESRTDIRLS
jgi:phenylacetate-coenzyme A ligase PaaK-like adenylate-forming protein